MGVCESSTYENHVSAALIGGYLLETFDRSIQHGLIAIVAGAKFWITPRWRGGGRKGGTFLGMTGV